VRPMTANLSQFMLPPRLFSDGAGMGRLAPAIVR
jgi:hypothetical protein